jgi:hypothetical protein
MPSGVVSKAVTWYDLNATRGKGCNVFDLGTGPSIDFFEIVFVGVWQKVNIAFGIHEVICNNCVHFRRIDAAKVVSQEEFNLGWRNTEDEWSQGYQIAMSEVLYGGGLLALAVNELHRDLLQRLRQWSLLFRHTVVAFFDICSDKEAEVPDTAILWRGCCHVFTFSLF